MGQWLNQVVTGFFNYHAVPANSQTLVTFRYRVADLWRRSLRCAQSERRHDVGADEPADRKLAAQTAHPSPLA